MLRRISAVYTAKARTIGLAGILITAAGCHDSSGPAATPPSVTAVAVKEEPNPLVRILSVELDQAAGIEIEYWTAAAPRLRVLQSTPATEHSVFLPRLRAGEVYDYEIRSLGAGRARGEPVKGQLRTDTLPSDLSELRFISLGSPSFPLVMIEVRGEPFSGYVVLDHDGAVVWYRRGVPESFTRRANGNFVLLESDIGLFEIRPDQEVVAELPSTGSMHLHHDVLATPDNTVLAIARDGMTFNGEVWTGEAIWEWSPEQATVNRRWTAWDFLSPATDWGPRSIPSDWLHANSLTYGPRRNVLVSFPTLNQVISIAPDFQSLEWRLGGPNATLAPATENEFWYQHTATEVAPGRVLLFDNGLGRPGDLFSRAMELELDIANGTATNVWEFRPRPDIYAPITSSARRLANGNTVINFGTGPRIVGASGPIAVYEVTQQGRVTWVLRIQGVQLLNYRATPLQDLAGESLITN